MLFWLCIVFNFMPSCATSGSRTQAIFGVTIFSIDVDSACRLSSCWRWRVWLLFLLWTVRTTSLHQKCSITTRRKLRLQYCVFPFTRPWVQAMAVCGILSAVLGHAPPARGAASAPMGTGLLDLRASLVSLRFFFLGLVADGRVLEWGWSDLVQSLFVRTWGVCSYQLCVSKGSGVLRKALLWRARLCCSSWRAGSQKELFFALFTLVPS